MSTSQPGQPLDMSTLAVEFVTMLPPDLGEALRAAAVPHWFNGAILAAVLAIPQERADRLAQVLARMPLVQPLGDKTYTVHELARHPLLQQMWQEDRRKQYQDWSRRAADYFESLATEENNPRLRVESIYHRLASDPVAGADEVRDQGAEWHNHFQQQNVFALVQAGLERDRAGWLTGRARGWLYYWLGLYQIRYSENRAAVTSLQTALESVERDSQLRADCMRSLGNVHVELSEYAQARACYEEALPIYRAIGSRLGEANCIQGLGDVQSRLSEYAQARACYEEALPIYRAIGNRLGEASCIRSLGNVQSRLSEYTQARACYEEALPIYRAIADRLGEAHCLRSLGDVQSRLSEYTQARTCYEEALPIYRAIGSRLGEANCIQGLGNLHSRLSEYAQARARYEEALPIYRAIGDRLGEANCIQGLGNVHSRLSEYTQARACYEEALPIYRAIGNRLGEASCIRSLGNVQMELGAEGEAQAAWQAAYEAYVRLGLPNEAANTLTSQTSLYNRKRDYIHSLRLYSAAIALAPQNAMWYRNRAQCFINLQDAASAEADIETAAALQPDHPYLDLGRGGLALLRGQANTAAGYFRSFITRLPEANYGYFNLSLALIGQEELGAAMESVHTFLAHTYAEQDVRDALYDLEQARKNLPSVEGWGQVAARLHEWLEEHDKSQDTTPGPQSPAAGTGD